MRKILPRFSLLTALLLMTIVGLTIGVVQLWREVEPLRAEVIARRAEMGELYITDPKKAHAIGVDWNVDGVWRWRLHLPQDRHFVICTYMGQQSSIPSENVETWLRGLRAGQGRIKGSVGGVRSGKSTFAIKLAKEGDQWYLQNGKGANTPIPNTFNVWLDDPESRFPVSKVLYSSQTVYEPGKPIVLLCVQRSNESRIDPIDGDTIVVWIEEDL